MSRSLSAVNVFHKFWLWSILAVWALFFGKAWFGQVYAKWREVKLFHGLSRNDQIQAIYGHEMPLLYDEVSNFPSEESGFLLVVPEKERQYPIANNPPLLRAITDGKYAVVQENLVENNEIGIMFSVAPMSTGSTIQNISLEPKIDESGSQ